MALVEEDFFTHDTALAQLKYAISINKPIYILKLRSVTLQMEFLSGAEIRSIEEFENIDDLKLAASRIISNMKGNE